MQSAMRAVQGVVYQESGLVIPPGLALDAWIQEAQGIQFSQRAMMWWLGDIFVWGEQRFGELYAQAIDDSEASVNSIQRAVKVCREFPLDRRRACGFSFHQAVMESDGREGRRIFTAEQADALLDLAVAKKMTREDFRLFLKERKAELCEERHPQQKEAEQSGEEPNAEPIRVGEVVVNFPGQAASRNSPAQPRLIEHSSIRGVGAATPSAVIESSSRADFLRELTELSRRYKIGISGPFDLFEMGMDDQERLYRADGRGKFAFVLI